MKYTLRYIANKTLHMFAQIFMFISIRLEQLSPLIKKELTLVNAYHGYTVQIDGVTLDFNLSHDEACELYDYLKTKRISDEK